MKVKNIIVKLRKVIKDDDVPEHIKKELVALIQEYYEGLGTYDPIRDTVKYFNLKKKEGV